MNSKSRSLIKELQATACRCGRTKRRGNTFCSVCYYSLPKAVQQDLYKRIGQGYEEAYDVAAQLLEGKGKA